MCTDVHSDVITLVGVCAHVATYVTLPVLMHAYFYAHAARPLWTYVTLRYMSVSKALKDRRVRLSLS